MKDDVRALIEAVEHAEDEIHQVMSFAEEARGYKDVARRADVIMGKLENIKWLLVKKASSK